jgi:chaperonin cofactor prefoldin
VNLRNLAITRVLAPYKRGIRRADVTLSTWVWNAIVLVSDDLRGGSVDDQTRTPPKFERWAAELTGLAHRTWRNGPGPEVLGKIGLWVALPSLDAADQGHLAVLQRTRRAIAAVATSAKQLELRIGELERQAGPKAGNSDDTLAELRRDDADMKARQERLVSASRRLQAEIDAFRQAMNAAKAAHIAAEEAAQSACTEMRNSRPQGAGNSR